jgi:bifunctional non-homologous end joining protein LigD
LLKKTGKITHFKPMLAILIEKPFNSDEWLFEIKWDGYRAIADIQKDSVLLYSRNDLNFNSKFPEIVESLKKMQITAVLDGEIVVLDEQGRSQFQLLQQYFKYKKGILVYYVFDILYFEGYELLGLPLITRKKLLNQILSPSSGNTADSTVQDLRTGISSTPGSSDNNIIDSTGSKSHTPGGSKNNIKISGHIEKEGIAFFNEAVKNGLEGIMAKKSDSIYIPGSRSSKWLKIKAKMRQEVVIAGYTEPRGSRNKIGSIITGLYDKGVLIFTGQAGSGFDEKELENLYIIFKKLETGICPFKTVPNTITAAHWIKPQLVAEVEFVEWTDKNLMRHPVFIGLRTDKDVLDVKIEKPAKLKIANGLNFDEKSNGLRGNMLKEKNSVILTNPDKIFWPEEKYTKKDLFQYYKNISEYILPYILNKPHSLNRCPDGIEGECFYQKDIDYTLPPWLHTRKIFAESKNEYIDYLVCTGTDSLLYMVNLGCIDIHPWSSTVDRLERPDYAILDLDPLDVDFPDVVIIAKVAKRVLDSIDIEGFCKTSGSKGIHIYVPLGAKYTYEQALDFVKIIAKLINTRQPDLTSLERSPDKRHKKVYLDCYQNRIGQTVAAPYCIRPRKGAPVSTPLQWKELEKNFRPADFNIKNIFHRLDHIGDLWKEVLGTGIDMEKCLEKLKSLI